MTSIRTLAELQDAMSEEFAWRKKELHSLKSLVISNEDTRNRNLFIRAAITLLYAHWEGFVGQIGHYYLEFVSQKRLKYEELSPHFLAMAVGRLVRNVSTSSKIQPCVDLVQFFETAMG